jgi:hypothetical protein
MFDSQETSVARHMSLSCMCPQMRKYECNRMLLAIHVKQIGDQDVAHGNQTLVYKDCLKLLLLAFSAYDTEIKLPVEHKHSDYTAETSGDDGNHPVENVPDGEYKVVKVNTDDFDVKFTSTNMDCFGNSERSGVGKPKFSFLPKLLWEKLIHAPKDQSIAKRCREPMCDTPFWFSGQVKNHVAWHQNAKDI